RHRRRGRRRSGLALDGPRRARARDRTRERDLVGGARRGRRSARGRALRQACGRVSALARREPPLRPARARLARDPRRNRVRRARRPRRDAGRDRVAARFEEARVTIAVETHDLFRIYASAEGNAAALQGLTLSVREREIVVVFGPSGSGKSTLLRILAGLDQPSAGTVEVFGTDLRRIAGRRLRAYRAYTLGYADQHYNRALEPELTARELVALRPR